VKQVAAGRVVRSARPPAGMRRTPLDPAADGQQDFHICRVERNTGCGKASGHGPEAERTDNMDWSNS